MRNICNFHRFVFEHLDEKYWDIDLDKKYTLYHATPASNVEAIMKDGINPSVPSGKPFSQALVWMADTIEGAKKHAESRMKKRGGSGRISIIAVAVDPKKITLHKGFAPGVYNAEGVVPPEFLSVLK